MRIATLLVSLGLAVSSASAAPTPSNHPRVGQLAEVNFARASARIDRVVRESNALGHVAAWSQEHPDGLVVLDGHATDAKNPAENMRLAVRRAKAVRDGLVELGVNPQQIVIAAYGDVSPKSQRHSVVVWATRAGVDAVVARTMVRQGHAVVWDRTLGIADMKPQPGVGTEPDPQPKTLLRF